jgi:hypothetical protein
MEFPGRFWDVVITMAAVYCVELRQPAAKVLHLDLQPATGVLL